MKYDIPFAPPYITKKEVDAVVKVLKSGWLTMGPETLNFEQKFTEYIGSKYALSTSSATASLFLSLKTLGIKDQDEVITTPFTFAATANIIVQCGGSPVFVDIEERTYNIDPSKIEEKISTKSKAIIVVHYGGQTADMEKIMKIAKRHNLYVIEDAAHAAGSEYESGDKVGSIDNLTAFSFYVTKPMTTGEGGMITFNNSEFNEKLKTLRFHGIDRDAWKRYLDKEEWYYEILEAGYKFNMTDLQAALGLEQLKKLDWMNNKRKEIAGYYDEKLDSLDIITPYINPKIKSSYHLYPIKLIKYERDKFIKEMAKRRIGTSVHFIPLHLMPFYRQRFGYKKGDFPVAEKTYTQIVSLPIFPRLKMGELEYIVDSIKEILTIN